MNEVTVRFAGDSGDGMQFVGALFSDAAAEAGNCVCTMPDYPSEVRAPAGTPAGVSGFQVRFASHDIDTPGDRPDALVAMNPAALRKNLADVKPGGVVIVNKDAFTAGNLDKAGYKSNPLDDGSIAAHGNLVIHAVPMLELTRQALAGADAAARTIDRAKNMFALGLASWLFDLPLAPALRDIADRFAKNPALVDLNVRVLNAGHAFAAGPGGLGSQLPIPKADLQPGVYRQVTGNQAVALGMVAAAHLAGRKLFYGSYPITPASEVLQELAALPNYNVITLQAEDEIAAIVAAIGAAFGGQLAATATSGPGMALMTEAIGLAVMTELPLVIVNVQRGGPSTGLPTKPEQSDLLQAVVGRNGECPVAVLAASSPVDCFAMTIEAFRVAVRYMVPVILLSDGHLGQGAQTWRVPKLADLAPIPIVTVNDPTTFQPYQRNADLARPWALPGTPGLLHRIGGLEKQDITGVVSHDPKNHQRMTQLRADKVAGIQWTEKPYLWQGDEQGDLLLVGWGSSYGAIRSAVESAREKGLAVSGCHVRCINPLAKDLPAKLRRFKKVLVAENNLGQLRLLLRAASLVDLDGLNKVQGRPFVTADIEQAIDAHFRSAT